MSDQCHYCQKVLRKGAVVENKGEKDEHFFCNPECQKFYHDPEKVRVARQPVKVMMMSRSSGRK